MKGPLKILYFYILNIAKIWQNVLTTYGWWLLAPPPFAKLTFDTKWYGFSEDGKKVTTTLAIDKYVK